MVISEECVQLVREFTPVACTAMNKEYLLIGVVIGLLIWFVFAAMWLTVKLFKDRHKHKIIREGRKLRWVKR